MPRILLAGLVGGLVLFMWGAFSHMVLPIGEMGISILPNEEPVVASLKANIAAPGFYFVPGLDMSNMPTDAEQQAWSEKIKAGPSAIIVYSPAGQEPMSPMQFGSEFLSNVLGALVAAFIVSLIAGSICKRAGIVTLLGLFAWLSISLSYWTWYKFPTAFIVGEGLDQVLGWLIAGLAIAWLLRRTPAAAVSRQPATAVAGTPS